jgi:hypothetical protein
MSGRIQWVNRGVTGSLLELRQAALSFKGDNFTRPTVVCDLVEVLQIASHSIVELMIYPWSGSHGISRLLPHSRGHSRVSHGSDESFDTPD